MACKVGDGQWALTDIDQKELGKVIKANDERQSCKAYFAGELERHELSQQDVDEAIAQIDTPEIPAA